MVPGFMQIPQDDQISLLKSGSFGVSLLYGAHCFMSERHCFVYNNQAINIETLLNSLIPILDENEKYFIHENLDFIRQLKQLNLSSSETALLSAIILFNPDNTSLTDQKSIYHNYQRFVELLRMEIENHRASTVSSLEKQQILQQLLNLVTVNIRHLTQTHFEIIKSFKIKYSQVEFPPLHRELFNVDYYVYCHQQQQLQLQQQQQQQQQKQHQIQHQTHQMARYQHHQQFQMHQNTQQPQFNNNTGQIKSENLMLSPSPSSCSSSSSSSNSSIPPSSLSPHSQSLMYDPNQYYYNNNTTTTTTTTNKNNNTNPQPNPQQHQQQAQKYFQNVAGTSSPSSSSTSSSSSSSSTSTLTSSTSFVTEFNSQTINDDVLLSSTKQEPIDSPKPTLTASSHSSPSMSPPSYASLTPAYTPLIKTEPNLFTSHPATQLLGIDTA